MATFAKATFSAASYATFRPTYPLSLYSAVLSYHQGARNLCIDLGCGHGIIARELAKHFTHVIGTDPSPGMIAQARSSTATPANVEFHQASAEDLSWCTDEEKGRVEDGSVDMVVAGQAAHWFDYPLLFKELSRVMRRGGTMAFWGYKDHVFVNFPRATQILGEYTYGTDRDLLGNYWSQPGRSIVQNKLRDIVPPVEEWEDVQRVEYEPGTEGARSGEGTMFLTKRMKVGECKEYIRTWSAYHGWKETYPDRKKRSAGGQGDVVDQMFDEIAKEDKEFGDEEKEVEVEWGSGLVMARKR
ncbi:trans-aconitate methyltransferase 1 [Elasticomyces elasticus]|nr:trans-aconitate methyltransferase 1 [Elasticomyces elasticus]